MALAPSRYLSGQLSPATILDTVYYDLRKRSTWHPSGTHYSQPCYSAGCSLTEVWRAVGQERNTPSLAPVYLLQLFTLGPTYVACASYMPNDTVNRGDSH